MFNDIMHTINRVERSQALKSNTITSQRLPEAMNFYSRAAFFLSLTAQKAEQSRLVLDRSFSMSKWFAPRS